MNLFSLFLVGGMSILGRWPFGYPEDVSVNSSLLGFSSGGGIYLYDVTDPTNPVYQTEVRFQSLVNTVLFDSLLYVGTDKALFVLEPSIPPIMRDSLLIEPVKDIYTKDSFAYIVTDELVVANIGNADSIFVENIINLGYSLTHISGDSIFLFVTSLDSLFVFDILTPQAPQLRGGFSFSFSTLEGSEPYLPYLYVLKGDSIVILNVSNPDTIYRENSISVNGWTKDFLVAGSYGYGAFAQGGLRIFSLSNPTNPVEIGSDTAVLNANQLDKSGNYAFITDREYGLRILNVTQPSSPVIVESLRTPYWTNSTFLQTPYLFVANGKGGVWILNVTQIDSSYVETYFDTPGEAFDVWAQDTLLLVSDGAIGGIRLYDISNISAPVELHYLVIPGEPSFFDVQFPLVYVVAGPSEGMHILDISDPTKIKDVTYFVTGGTAQDIAYWNGYTFVADGDSITILDVSDTSNVFLVTKVPSQNDAQGLAFEYPYLFVAEGWNGGFSIWNISNINNPALVDYVPTSGNTTDVVFINPYLYLACGQNQGIKKFDTQNLPNPVDSIITNGFSHRLFTNGTSIFVSEGPLGVTFLSPVTGITEKKGKETILHLNMPNLFRKGMFLLSPGGSSLTIFDISGRVIHKNQKIIPLDKRGVYILKYRYQNRKYRHKILVF